MITIEDFEALVANLLHDNLNNNESQKDAIEHQGENILMLAAGPGSGKTRVLVLRALRHILVDDILPENIVITTFTRKAAKELRTRWLDWGSTILETLQNRNLELHNYIERNIDINRCRIDTLDSIAEQTLTEFRLPGQVAPILIDESAAKIVLKRQAFREIYLNNRGIVDDFLSRFSFDGEAPDNQVEALRIVKTICERLVHDRVNLAQYANVDQAHSLMVQILRNYNEYLRQTNLFDYAFLEQILLERIQAGFLSDWCSDIHALLIDEYQDTNPLQEAIYFEIIRRSNSWITVVGDDDQAMYRFRGGSVELFTHFIDRCFESTGRHTRRIDMIVNYRSSNQIVGFYNNHVRSDTAFTSARITPTKPEVVSNRGNLEIPILGMFRPDAEVLADDLASWLQNFIVNRQTIFTENGNNFELRLTENGNLGDFVFLAHSVNEENYNRFGRNGETRFTGFFRQALENRNLHVFNPRGRPLRTIRDVQILLGLLLICLDPDGVYSASVRPTNEAQFFLDTWRNVAQNFILENPNPSDSGGLQRFVNAWGIAARGDQNDFPLDWPALELIFKLITWMPDFQKNPEHQVWLEAITRVVANAGMASPYGMQIYQEGDSRERSRQSFIRDALIPIAENEIDVDEEIMPSVPRDYLQLMTIHQSKGLEFPLVIVDVGSHFKTNHWRQKFLRFPEKPSNVVIMEDDVEAFLSTPLRVGRQPLDRTFDDLVRLYYVAFSRPQSVLLLVGCEKCLTYGDGTSGGAIPNVALGWSRNGLWSWRQPFAGRRPIRVNTPFLNIN